MRTPNFFRLRYPVILLAALVFLGLSAAACAARPAAETAPRADLVVVMPEGEAAQAMQAAAAAYQQGSGRTVRVETLAGDLYATQVNAALLAGLDRYDLVFLDADALARWAGDHALQPLEKALDTQATAPWQADVTVGGAQYGLPVQPDPLVLWYRADLLAQQGLGVPQDWTAFRKAALALNAPPERYGAAIAGSDQEAGTAFAGVLAGFGATAVNGAYQVEVDSPSAEAALALYAGLRNQDHTVQPGADQAGSAEVVAALRMGKAAMGLAPLSAARQLTQCAPGGADAAKVCAGGKPLLAWAWLPGVERSTAVGRLDCWAIPLHARPAAQDFIAWLGSDAGARAWAGAGGLPANTRVLAEPAIAARIPEAAALSGLHVFNLAFPQAVTVSQLWKASHQAVHAAVAGSAPPETALQTAAQQMRQALRQGGY